jgi:hypothetical protein
MKIEKGMIVSADTCWYVVVEQVFIEDTGKTYVNCICDNANNIYAFEPNEIHSYMTLKEVGNLGWDKPDREIHEHLKGREIPYRVIVEVLSGKHDDRF